MNWKYLAVSAVFVICFFLFLASVWYDMVPIADLYLEGLVVTPEGAR